MLIPTFLELVLFIVFNITSVGFLGSNSGLTISNQTPSPTVLAAHTISLEKRYANAYVNQVFKDNILLNIAYLADKVANKNVINWSRITQPFHYQISLNPGEVFAFHDDVLPQYQRELAKTTNAHFNSAEGFKSDGYLVGDGVCHLASIIYWAAKDAGLTALAPTNHDFMPIPQIPKEFGVSIYAVPGQSYSNQKQNLYITNEQTNPVVFNFDYDGENLKVSVLQNYNSGLIRI